MSPLASYRRLLTLAGPLYVAVAFVGRLPLAMSQLGTLVLVAGQTGSYAVGGGAAGALAVANAVGAPVAGAVADRVGQRRVVLAQSLLGGAALLALVAVATGDVRDGLVVMAAAAAGLVLPQVGPLARVRWRPLLHHRDARESQHHARLLETAFAYEGAADEASFVLGPALVGVLAVAVDPAAALAAAAVLLLGFGTAFALHPTARLAHALRPPAVDAARLLGPAFAVLCGAQWAIGTIFGSVQTGTTALTTAAGAPGLAGLVHATLGVGSVLAGLAMAAVPERVGLPLRVLVTAAGLGLLSLPLLAVDTVPGLFLAVLALGLMVAPYMISVFVLGERAVPAARVGTALTLLASVTGLGYAVGSALAGRAADAHGPQGAFAVTVAAGAVAVILAACGQPSLRRLVARAA